MRHHALKAQSFWPNGGGVPRTAPLRGSWPVPPKECCNEHVHMQSQCESGEHITGRENLQHVKAPLDSLKLPIFRRGEACHDNATRSLVTFQTSCFSLWAPVSLEHGLPHAPDQTPPLYASNLPKLAMVRKERSNREG